MYICIYVIFTIPVTKIIMSNAADVNPKELIWSTWDELLLAFAVKRHGLKDWDRVATELQNRHRSSSPPILFTPQICKNKYRNLRRRFTDHGGAIEENELPCEIQFEDDENDCLVSHDGDGDESDSFPWLEELRKLRVAELKQEVHRHDLSIRSLQMKVNTLEEEEREKNSKNEADDRNDDVRQPDLDEGVKQERSGNDKNDDKETPEDVAGKSVSADGGENMSFNESNSTESKRIGFRTEPTEIKPEPELKPVGGEVSCNDSSASQEREKGGADSDELRDSLGESKEGTKESSEVQSSASLSTRKKRRRGGVDSDGVGGGRGGGGGGVGAAVSSPATAPIKQERGEGKTGKSEPSIAGFLDKIRSHKLGSVFERRLESQKTEKYKSTIRRHVDLETVQARIDNGSYSLGPAKFYVDLLLLFTNAVVFFPKSSPESLAAEELRQLVMEELKNNSSDPLPEPKRSESLLAQPKSTNPIMVSRKRSLISAKASSSSANNLEKQLLDDKVLIMSSQTLVKSTSNEEDDSAKLKIKEKPVTGMRSMRRSSKGRPHISKPEPAANSSSNNKNSRSQQPGSKDKGDKKKSEAIASTKKSGAADFLKRIKKNSPVKETLVQALKGSRDNNSSKGSKKDQPKKKLDQRKDGLMRRSGGGGRKHAKEESSPLNKRAPKKGKDVDVTRKKRGREGEGEGEGEESSKRPKNKKRSR